MQPAGQNGTVCELVSGSREGNKHALRHVLGQVRVANHAQRGGIDEVNVPAHQFGEGHLRPGLSVIAQKLLVGQIVHSWNQIKIKRLIKNYERPTCGISEFLILILIAIRVVP